MKNKTNWAVTVPIALGSLLILFPLYLAIAVALKSPEELANSILGLPKEFHLENFMRAIEMTNFFQAFQNSAFVTVIAVVFTILTNSMVAYAIARNMDKTFFKSLYYYLISAMFIPFPLIMLPIVKETSALGMNNLFGLSVLYIVYGLSLNIFIYVGYIRSIPRELEEAAIVDGASAWGVFWKVIFPLLSPMNATVGILTCLWAWNDFMLPLIILNDPEMATLPLKQYIFQGQFSTDYNTAFASYLLALSPLVIVYLFAQKWVISGVTKGAIK
ncbi:carbohydrate ABC transporter permease [Lihuaxuella thermophila]|uniref:Raffinose/stachyose/melibiose transport system permease protein n=1 Tax=Lihuaxuella thermophila TaxID=1173111 RepID=A0A1H8GTG9_9BACL|nr:carbohydrate ABC transporter permease [Lihuaxuella thermophila]SEN47004.1 raffinose/stachyose/melibiose transport system permease protein [Lihuaxuella thermophila]